MSDPSIVDYWSNLFTSQGLKRLYRDPPEFAWPAGAWSLGGRLSGRTVEEFINMMDESGVAKVGIPAMKLYNWKERHLIWDLHPRDISNVLDAAPDRFFGLYGINPLECMSGVKNLESAIRDHNFIGAVMHPHGFGLPPNAPDWFPFYAKCAELDVPVFSLVGHAAEEMPSEPGRPLHLEQVALYFPELRIVGVSGWPWVAEMVSMAWKFPNVYYGTSQYRPKHWDPELLNFAKGHGAGKVLFGTGFPVLEHQQALAEVNQLGFDESALKQLLSGTAHAVFGDRLRS